MQNFKAKSDSIDRPGDGFSSRVFAFNDDKSAFNSKMFIERISERDLRIIRKYWDKDCDNLLSMVVEKNPKSFPVSELVVHIIEYWERIQKLGKYQRETHDRNHAAHWEWLLREFSAYKLSFNAHYKLMRKRRICNGCGKSFSELSIDIHTAMSLEKNIKFCNYCYYYIYHHRFMANTSIASQLPSDTMLGFLFDLSRLLEFIPTRTYMENIVIPGFPTEKQIELVKLLLKMPAFDIYIERFGNWLKALCLSGILNDGHRKTNRGIQCLANDGHVCLSLGEKAIDDWLSSHSIPHEKEVFYPFDDLLNPYTLSRTDWKVDDVYIEYAGLMENNEYAIKIGKKKHLASKYQLRLVIVEPKDLFDLDTKLGFLAKI